MNFRFRNRRLALEEIKIAALVGPTDALRIHRAALTKAASFTFENIRRRQSEK
jgi:hypothetical protein